MVKNSIKLNKSVYLVSKRNGKLNIWKSCPKCSKLNGKDLEFKLLIQKDDIVGWNYSSSDFGFTKTRETTTNPLGVQSLCRICRSSKRLSGLKQSQIKGDVISIGKWCDIEKSL